MRTNQYLLDDLERSQQEATERRRSKRSRRYYRTLFCLAAAIGLIVLAAPSLVSHSGIAKSYVVSAVQSVGWSGSVESVSVGWITPLTVKQLELTGASGETTVSIDRSDSSLTVLDLLWFDPSSVGELTLRGVRATGTVAEGQSSIESDLAKWLAEENTDGSDVRVAITMQDVQATLTDRTTGAAWRLDQSNLSMQVDGDRINGDVAGLVREPDGSEGAFQSHFEWSPPSVVATGESEKVWELSFETESFPLSLMNLAATRSGAQGGIPKRFGGDTTGSMKLIGASNGSIQASIQDLRIRNLQMFAAGKGGEPGQQWSNSLATLDGQLSLSDGWLIGYGLEATTDFAKTTIDGAFPTRITWTGSGDNPISWLQALDGKAEVQVDLAALDSALPGLIPLRAGATLVSGRATATIENGSLPDRNGGKQSKLTIASEAVRARANGRAVVIEPIELIATVSNDNGEIRAEQFDLTSRFATATGQGTIKAGAADFQVDFGRLYAMLRPVVDLSEFSLGGTAGGRIHWNATPTAGGSADRWELGGKGEGKNLLVTLPGGNRFERSVVLGEVAAVGTFKSQRLEELSSAYVTIRSGGVLAKAELAKAVAEPTARSTYPLRISGDGRLENLSESLGAWLPDSLRNAEGRATWTAEVEAGQTHSRLNGAVVDLVQPRIVIGDQWYSQPNLRIDFDGVVDYPSGNFYSKDFTVVGDSISVAIRGEASRENTNLDVAWKADLQRLQQSMGSRYASAQATVRPISHRPVRPNSYQVIGKCEGKAKVTAPEGKWRIEGEASGTGLRLLHQVMSAPVPPGTPTSMTDVASQPTFGQSFRNTGRGATGVELWNEPHVTVSGPIEYDPSAGVFRLIGVQVANDWFAGTLSGQVASVDDQTQIELRGPTRWKMDEVARRLTQLLRQSIRAEGVHETELSVKLSSDSQGQWQLESVGELGWQSCEVFGFILGPTTFPVRIANGRVQVAAAQMSVRPITAAGPIPQGGSAKFAGEYVYSESPAYLRIDAGSALESISVTPEITADWLKYAAPLAAGATTIDGTFGILLDESTVVPDNPLANSIRGTLNVQSMRLSSGPLASQLISSVKQLKAVAKQEVAPFIGPSQQTWLEMPPQRVEFAMNGGVISHQRMYFQIDRAQVMTSGHVNLDTQMSITAQIPLDARWLGSDLQGLAGQSVTFPISGSLSRPALDPSGVRDVVARLGVQAGTEVIQNRLDSVIQKQLGTGLEQINSGIEKIFGF